MKNTLIVFSVLLSITSFAKTTLRLPVELSEGESLVVINKELKKKGIKEIPRVLEVSSDVEKPWEVVENFQKDVVAKGKKIKKEISVAGQDVPKGVCYTTTDKTEDVIELIFSLTDVYFSDQMSFLASAYKNIKKIAYDSSTEVVSPASSEEIKEENKRLESESKLWKEWRGKGEAILMLASVGDSGDDVQESLIYKCR